ncbi:hypothetical protein VKT23_008942 [Stygiomarasmius scandens]|uniref:Epidermal growth factor receptor-like transmembrane-juxtamembrane segment domain-containing protein n=1 Tax=Marasmiellus scandens TaxID=2682957 RepID=A0ABR1JG04_9AGAR
MAFYGFTPPANLDQSFSSSINGSVVTNSSNTYTEANIGGLWFTSVQAGNLPFEQITIGPIGSLLVFDYAIAPVAEFENLRGQTIFVDDSNSEIQWAGAWQEKRNYTLFGEVNLPRGDITNSVPTRPHGNGTHESDSVGASMAFQFQGSSVLIAGVAPMNRTVEPFTRGPGLVPPVSDFLLELNVTLDGESQSVVFTNGELLQPGGTPHFPYFKNDSLEEGNHTLIMTIKNVTGNASATIDYITYKPTFDILQDKPNFPPIALDNNTSPVPSPTMTPLPDPESKSNVGVIAGAVVGGVVLLVLLILGFWLLWRRKKRAREEDDMNVTPNAQAAVEPFVLAGPVETSTRKGAQFVSPQRPSTIGLTSKGEGQRAEAGPSPSPLVLSPTEQHAELRRQRDELTETVRDLELQSERGDSSNQNDFATQDQIREMQARVDMLTREMSRYIVPPAYESR